ncbi:MAG: hypothetical protein ISS28_08430 [Candidatus Cloacimonetes bacterium]|nr:hypothetical protein [Candidatus Cloacimonadota bacterium]MBL7087098.1 hypothetical protein [Candidatus Cloacimonadota bacterium]
MELIQGSITKDEKVIIEDIEVWIETSIKSGIRSWHGGFEVSSPEVLELGNSYTFSASDGRSGKILIQNIRLGSHKNTQILFIGTGPFK